MENKFITIGRSKECDIVVTGDETVSGVHCRLYVVDGKYVFENLGRNGSTLNNQLLTGKVTIAPNSPVMIGMRTQLPWVIIQRMLPLAGVPVTPAAGRNAGAPRPPMPPRPRPVPQPAPQPRQEPVYEPVPEYYDGNPEDTTGFGWWILSFLVPLVGFILFFVWKNRLPNRARKSCLIPAIIGAAVTLTMNIISLAL